MELATIDWLIIVGFLLLSLAIGIRYTQKASGSLTNFFLGGRNLPWYIAGISMVATTFAADTPLAVTEMVAQNGISKNWLWWSFLAGGLLTTFFFAQLWRRAEVLTEPELIELRYSGWAARALRGFKAVYLGIFMNCMIIAWVNLAMGSILTEFFGLPESEIIWWILGLMTLAVVYSSLSGLLGVAITDTIQFFIAMIGVIILAIIVLNHESVGGITNLKAALPEGYFDFFPSLSSTENESGGSGFTTLSLSIGAFLSFVAVQWWASWYPGAEPGGGGYVAQRFMSTKNEKHAVYATLFFNIGHYCLRPWPWIIVALAAVYLYSPQYNFPDEALGKQIHFVSQAHEDVSAVYAAYPSVSQEVASHPELENALIKGISDKETLFKAMPALEALYTNDEAARKAIDFQYAPRLGYIYAMKDFLPVGLKGLLLVAFLAAYLSTISTQINWGASYLVNDLHRRFIRPEQTFKNEATAQRHYVLMSRVFSVVIMLIGLVAGTFVTSISGVWEFIMECGAGLGLVLILRWYWWRINAWSEIAATLAPFAGYAIGHYALADAFGPEFVAQKGTFLFTVGFTTITWIAVTYLTPPTETATLHRFYQRVKPEGRWQPIRQALGVDKSSEKGQTRYLLLCWIGALVMVYSLLFTIGKLILQEWTDAGIYGIAAITGFFTLMIFLRKTNIYNS